jgi:hypothetical protein
MSQEKQKGQDGMQKRGHSPAHVVGEQELARQREELLDNRREEALNAAKVY